TGVSPGDAQTSDASDGGGASDGLILYYAFDDHGVVAADGSGRGHDGVLDLRGDAGGFTDASSAWTAGRKSGALLLGGAEDVSIPSGVLTGVTAMTVGMWVRLDSVSPWSRFFDLGHGPGAGEHWTFLTPSGVSGLQWNMYGGPPADGSTFEAVVSPGTQLPTGVWKHVAVTSSGS